MSIDLTRAKQAVLAFCQQSAVNLAGLVPSFDAASGKMLALGLASAPGVLDKSRWTDQSTSGTPPLYTPGDFGPPSSVYAALTTQDVADLYAAVYALRQGVTPQVTATLLKWLP